MSLWRRAQAALCDRVAFFSDRCRNRQTEVIGTAKLRLNSRKDVPNHEQSKNSLLAQRSPLVGVSPEMANEPLHLAIVVTI
jgi:hypothetical protein